jgi:hypothetical protein
MSTSGANNGVVGVFSTMFFNSQKVFHSCTISISTSEKKNYEKQQNNNKRGNIEP